MRRIALVALASLPLVAGCVDPNKVGLEARLQTLVGGSEQDLVRRLGAAPTQVVERGGIRYVSWMYFWPEQSYGAVAMAPSATPGAADRTTRFCEATFAVEQGRVGGYSLRGDWCAWGGYPRVAPV
jgi:hypothetical protein